MAQLSHILPRHGPTLVGLQRHRFCLCPHLSAGTPKGAEGRESHALAGVADTRVSRRRERALPSPDLAPSPPSHAPQSQCLSQVWRRGALTAPFRALFRAPLYGSTKPFATVWAQKTRTLGAKSRRCAWSLEGTEGCGRGRSTRRGCAPAAALLVDPASPFRSPYSRLLWRDDLEYRRTHGGPPGEPLTAGCPLSPQSHVAPEELGTANRSYPSLRGGDRRVA
jgi:hypothetical protein